MGREALLTATTAGSNIAIGYRSLYLNTSGSNTAVGTSALQNNTSGTGMVAVGYQAGTSNQTGVYLTAVGFQAGYSSTSNYNTFIGRKAGYGATGGTNTYVGSDAGAATSAQTGNVGVGAFALTASTSGSWNSALGRSALQDATSAIKSTAVGARALQNVTSGIYNTAVGYDAGAAMVGNSENVFVGYISGQATTGGKSTFVGSDSGKLITSGANNTILGRFNGNQGGLDIRTSSNNIVLSDGDGNPRTYIDNSGIQNISSGVIRLRDYLSGTPASGDYFDLYHFSDNTLRMNFNGSGADEFQLDTSGRGYFRGGLYLGANSSANLLDDYEEGTWTPTLARSSSNPTASYVAQSGTYTKVGNKVFVSCLINLSSWSGGAGWYQIEGLPFAVQSGGSSKYTQTSLFDYGNYSLSGSSTVMGGYFTSNSTYIALIGSGGGSDSSVNNFTPATNFYAYVSGTYFTAS
jgi:hypothetical protein